MAQAHAVRAVQDVAEAHLPQVVSALLVVAALSQLVPRVSTGDVGEEIGGVVGQQSAADQLFFLPRVPTSAAGACSRGSGSEAGKASGRISSKASQKAWELNRSGAKSQNWTGRCRGTNRRPRSWGQGGRCDGWRPATDSELARGRSGRCGQSDCSKDQNPVFWAACQRAAGRPKSRAKALSGVRGRCDRAPGRRPFRRCPDRLDGRCGACHRRGRFRRRSSRAYCLFS